MTNVKFKSCVLAVAAAAACATQLASAVEVTVTRPAQEPAAFEWTDAAFASAKPMLPNVSFLPAHALNYNAAVAEAASTLSAVSVAGGIGGVDARNLRETRAISQQAMADLTASAAAEIAPQAVGTGGMHFTSTRTFPNNADTTYPTRTVGKLYFRDAPTNTNYVCSGSMIKPGVVLTSGHCIHNGVNRFYSAFMFRPGLRLGVFPYGSWTNWTQGRTTTAWVTGGGSVPNTGDWATIVFGPNSSGFRIGNYTGWLGYQFNICSGRHQTTLGYPVNLDGGVQMQRSDSQANSYGSLNNCTWGTDMTGGSSGGPVVLNLRVTASNSGTLPLENNDNRVVATVSWGYVSPGIKVQGGSIVNSVFGTLINDTCAANPGAC